MPDVSMATTDMLFGNDSVMPLMRQLDSFKKKDLFLGRFRMLGRSDRRRGGAPPFPHLSPSPVIRIGNKREISRKIRFLRDVFLSMMYQSWP